MLEAEVDKRRVVDVSRRVARRGEHVVVEVVGEEALVAGEAVQLAVAQTLGDYGQVLLVRVELVPYAQAAGQADDETLDARVGRRLGNCSSAAAARVVVVVVVVVVDGGRHDEQAGAAGGGTRTRVGKERLADGVELDELVEEVGDAVEGDLLVERAHRGGLLAARHVGRLELKQVNELVFDAEGGEHGRRRGRGGGGGAHERRPLELLADLVEKLVDVDEGRRRHAAACCCCCCCTGGRWHTELVESLEFEADLAARLVRARRLVNRRS